MGHINRSGMGSCFKPADLTECEQPTLFHPVNYNLKRLMLKSPMAPNQQDCHVNLVNVSPPKYIIKHFRQENF